MKQVQTSGVLMVFSQAWIEELYHQVLDRNMLGEAGYWGSPEDNSLPLITMLTGQWLLTWLCAAWWGEGGRISLQIPFREAMVFEADLETAPTKLLQQPVTVSEKCHEFASQEISIPFPCGTLRSSQGPIRLGIT